MEYTSLLVGLIAVLVAWRTSRQVKYLQERLDSTNNRYFLLINQLRELEETMQGELMDLRVELRRQAGLLKFEPQMTIGEIYAMHPRAVVTAEPVQLTGNLDWWSGQGTTGPHDHNLVAAGVQRPAAAAAAGRAGRGAQRDLAGATGRP